MTIDKIVMREPGWDTDLETVSSGGEIPTPGPGQVTVALEASGVCHRDLIDRADHEEECCEPERLGQAEEQQ